MLSSTTLLSSSMLPAIYPSYVVIYYIPPPRDRKWFRWALLPAQLWCQYQSTKQDNDDECGDISSPSAKPGATLTRVKKRPLAGIAHVEDILGPSESMNERSLIPLPLAKLAKKWTVQPSMTHSVLADWSHCFGWFYAAACCWSLSFGWLNSVVCYRRMIYNSNCGIENRALTVKEGAFAWKEWVRLQFQWA